MAVIGALREGLDLTDCLVYWESSYANVDYNVSGKMPVQGQMRLANSNGYLEVPVVWDADNATIVVTNLDESTSSVNLQEYCLENGFMFSIRHDGIITYVADDDSPEGDITIPLMVDGEQLDSVTFTLSALSSPSEILTLDSNAESGGEGGLG